MQFTGAVNVILVKINTKNCGKREIITNTKCRPPNFVCTRFLENMFDIPRVQQVTYPSACLNVMQTSVAVWVSGNV